MSTLSVVVGALFSLTAYAQDEELPRIRISRSPSESLQTDDVGQSPRTARLQPRESDSLPPPRSVIVDSIVESDDVNDEPTILVDEAARRRRRRRQRHSSLLFASAAEPSVYEGAMLGSGYATRVTRTPAMFGDIGGAHLSLSSGSITAGVPLASASRLLKIGENNQAMPLNRAYVAYNRFQNAFALASGSSVIDADSVDRLLFGFEKTLCCGDWSVELRMPFTHGVDLSGNNVRVTGGEVGDLLVSLKRLIYHGECVAIASGLGLTVPTGSGVHATINNAALQIENDALHLHPYLAITSDAGDGWFYHGFFQLDIPMNGNDAFASAGGTTQSRTFDEVPIWHVDLSAGYWLTRSPLGCGNLCPVGIAAIGELHYTSSLDNSGNSVNFNPMGQNVTLQTRQFSVLNATFGLHTELGNGRILRAGVVFPLGTGTTKLFDAEFQATVIQPF